MGESELERQLAVLKDVLYVDKVYGGLDRLRTRLREPRTDLIDLRLAELRIFSQNGEDGVLVELLHQFDVHPEYFVEFGVGDGWSCNTRILAESLGWAGTYFEIDPVTHAQLATRYVNADRITARERAISPDNITAEFEDAGVPHRFGVLSIDIDGQDYWVWEALSDAFEPAVVIAEVNTNFAPGTAVSEAAGTEQGPLTATFGASLAAMEALGRSKGYRLVHVESAGVNAFFVREDLLAGRQVRGVLDRSPNFGLRGRFHSPERLYGFGPHTDRPTVTVQD